MLEKGPAKKVTIWVNEDTRHHHEPLWLAIFDYLRHKQIAGASVTHTKMSFGDRQRIHNADLAETPELSYRIEFIESPARVEETLPTLYEMVSDGLIEVHDTTVIKAAQKGSTAARSLLHQRKEGPAKLLRVFIGEADRWHDDSLYDAIVKQLRMMEIAGVTVYRGILGYGAKGHEHRKSFFHISRDLPIMLSVVDTSEKIEGAAKAIEGMLDDGLIVISDVDIVRLVRGKTPAEVPHASGTTS